MSTRHFNHKLVLLNLGGFDTIGIQSTTWMQVRTSTISMWLLRNKVIFE